MGCALTLTPPTPPHASLDTAFLGGDRWHRRGPKSHHPGFGFSTPPRGSCGVSQWHFLSCHHDERARDGESLPPAESRRWYFAGQVQHKLPNISDTADRELLNGISSETGPTQSSFASMSCFAMGVKLSMSSPRATSTGIMCGGTSWWLRCGAIESSVTRSCQHPKI